MRALLPLFLATACSPPVVDVDNTASVPVEVSNSRDVEPSRAPGVIGVVAGPCGAEKGGAFLGRRWTVGLQSRLQAVTGASSVRVMPPPQGAVIDQRLDPHRVNVLLDDTRRIIMLDCG